MQDPREYFDSQQVNVVKALHETVGSVRLENLSLGPQEAYEYMVDQISNVRETMNDPVIRPEVAMKVCGYNFLTVNRTVNLTILGLTILDPKWFEPTRVKHQVQPWEEPSRKCPWPASNKNQR